MNPLVMFALGYAGWAAVVVLSFLLANRFAPRNSGGLAVFFLWVGFNSLMGIAISVTMGFLTNHHPIPWVGFTILGLPIWWVIFSVIRDTLFGR